ncbi:MAG: PQQ-binding-like beta-propeller repeat protein [Planctomyces sp.]|nr:PQQ-binding-like beta-propeller repeat protein [Planctomyces sp.]
MSTPSMTEDGSPEVPVSEQLPLYLMESASSLVMLLSGYAVRMANLNQEAHMKRSSLVLYFLCLTMSQMCFAADWPQFRGPKANGVTNDAVAPTSWGVNENLKWQTDIPGAGWSSPIVVDGKVFVTTAVTDGPQNKSSNYRWEILCLDAKTGTILWTKTALEGNPRLETHRDNTYASETPVSDGKYILAYFGMMGMYCYDLDGVLIWKKDLGLHPMAQDWGTSSSPAILDGKVFVQVDNEEASFVVAIDIRTGDEVWRQPRDERSNWGSAIIWENSHRRELVTGGAIVRSYDPGTGDLLWQVDIGNGGLNATPTASGDLLVVGRSGRGGTSFFAIRSGTDDQLASVRTGNAISLVAWNTREFGPHRASPVIVDGLIYLLDGRGGKVTIVESETGTLVTQGRLPEAGEFWASPWSNQGKIYCLDASGRTFVLQPDRTLGVVTKNVLPVADDVRFWSTPALADGTLFIRSSNKLYAIGSN